MRLSNSEYNKLKSATKNATDITLRLSKNIVGTNETSFQHNLLLTNEQDLRLFKSFANNSLASIKKVSHPK